MREYGDTFLLAPFREFYKEVMRLRQLVVDGTWASAASVRIDEYAADASSDFSAYGDDFPEVLHDAEPVAGRGGLLVPAASPAALLGGGPDADAGGEGAQLASADDARAGSFVLQSLVTLLKRQEAQALRYGGTFGAEFYKEAQYVMAALADEIFLNTTEWEGSRSWVSNLLESRMFRTHVAGELFFQKLDRLLVERDPVFRDLAAVYLMALSLGFRGKYHRRDDRQLLKEYRSKLFQFVYRREPELDSPARQLFPEAYYHTLRDETKRRLPNPRAWIILLCAVVLAYITLTHAVWTKLTDRLFEENKQIQTTAGDMSRGS
jgi:type VI secretion system protein ImpK